MTAALLALVLAAAGCSSGPPRPIRLAPQDAPSATVRNIDEGFIGVEVYLVSVDGRPVPYRRLPLGHDTSVPVILPAGVRRLEVTIEEGAYLWGYVFDYPFTAGHSYTLTYTRQGDRRVVVYDRTTRTKVVIEKPNAP
jgi:hypothetical protein